MIGKNYVGGLVGLNYGHITNCAALPMGGNTEMMVTGKNSTGGLVGSIIISSSSSSSITNCYATGNVTGGTDTGGLVGSSSSSSRTSITNCYATGNVTGTDGSTGGLVGYSSSSSSSITNSFFNNTNTDNNLGTAKSLTEMKDKSTFTNWDFTFIWSIDPTGYPYLQINHTHEFIITQASQLADLAMTTNMGYDFSGKTIKLGDTIDLAPWLSTNNSDPNPGWMPIGTNLSYPFNGTFDGQGYTIKGLWINGDGKYCVGLFGYTYTSSRIMNLTVEIDNTGTGNPGIKKGVIGNNYVGGLVGLNDGHITNCAALPMGGNTGMMVTGKNHTGGLVGSSSSSSSSITNCYATGDVKGTDSSTGGLVGYSYSSSITNCYATGNVTGGTNTGGLVGSSSSSSSSSITNCYATGEVKGTEGSTGGLVGNNNRTITNSFFNTATTKQSRGIGKGTTSGTNVSVTDCTTEDLKTLATFTTELGAGAWDFATDWAIDASASSTFNGGMPYLRWQTPTVTMTVTDDDLFTYEAGGISPVTADKNMFAVASGDPFTFTFTPNTGYTAAEFIVKAGTKTLTPVGGQYQLLSVVCDTTITISPPTFHIVTLTADPGINLLPSAGIHSAIEGKSFYFYVTLAPGFEGRTPQASINGKPVDLILRPNGTEWMYVIPGVDTDMLVALTFNTTANDNADAPRLYSRDSQLFVETPAPLTLTVYSVTGQTVASRRLSEGLTTIPLPTGIYIVRMDERVEKVTVRR